MELLQVAKMKEQVREKDVMSSCPISKEDESNQNCGGIVLLTVITDYGGMREDKAISGWVCRLTEWGLPQQWLGFDQILQMDTSIYHRQEVLARFYSTLKSSKQITSAQ